MSILDELAKEDSKWRMIALKICGNKSLADDLVQEAYLSVMDKKEVKCSYMYRTILNKFLNHTKENKQINIDDLSNLQSNDDKFEPDDDDLKILNRFRKINWRQQDLISESYDKSLRQIEESFPMINYAYAYRQIKEGTEIVLADDIYKYKNTRCKR